METQKRKGSGIASMLLFVAAVVAFVVLMFFTVGYLLGQFLL